MSGFFVKNPGTDLVVGFDWAQQDLADGETITGDLGWIVTPAGDPGTLTTQSESNDATTTTATVAFGIAGEAYLVTSAIATSLGREIRRSVTVRVANT